MLRPRQKLGTLSRLAAASVFVAQASPPALLTLPLEVCAFNVVPSLGPASCFYRCLSWRLPAGSFDFRVLSCHPERGRLLADEGPAVAFFRPPQRHRPRRFTPSAAEGLF
jgi:hypothetical protein